MVLMTNFVSFLSGLGNGRAFAWSSVGRGSGARAAWLEEAMMGNLLSQMKSRRKVRAEEKNRFTSCADYGTSLGKKRGNLREVRLSPRPSPGGKGREDAGTRGRGETGRSRLSSPAREVADA